MWPGAIIGTAAARGGAWQPPVEQWTIGRWLGASAGARGHVLAFERDAPFSPPLGAVAGPGAPLDAMRELTEPVPANDQGYYETETSAGAQHGRTPKLGNAALDSDGRMLGVWQEYSDVDSRTGRTLGWMQRADGSWCTPTVIVQGDPFVEIAFDSVGGGIMAWDDAGGIHVASYTADDTCPPPFAGPLGAAASAPPGPDEPPVDAGPSPTGSAPAVTPPVVTIAASARASRDRRTTRVRLGCASRTTCRGSVGFSGAASQGFAVAPDRARVIRLRLQRAVRLRLRRSRTVRVAVEARLTGGRRVTRTVRVLRAR
jgi:hypothetical protein